MLETLAEIDVHSAMNIQDDYNDSFRLTIRGYAKAGYYLNFEEVVKSVPSLIKSVEKLNKLAFLHGIERSAGDKYV